MNQRLEVVRKRIREAAEVAGRSAESITLVAVSKTKPMEKILEALRAGVTVFGENYVQEAREKFNALYAYPISWHFIGHLQSNKAKYAVKMFDLIHTVDSMKLATEIDRQAKKIGKVQKVLVQVNVDREVVKSGVTVEETAPLIRGMSRLENLAVMGLMTMPPFFDDPERARPCFRSLRRLGEEISMEKISGVSMEALSMGMTGDFEVAIAEGATLVRIGTAIFGERE